MQWCVGGAVGIPVDHGEPETAVPRLGRSSVACTSAPSGAARERETTACVLDQGDTCGQVRATFGDACLYNFLAAPCSDPPHTAVRIVRHARMFFASNASQCERANVVVMCLS